MTLPEQTVLQRAAALFDRDVDDLAPHLRDGVLDLLDPAFVPTVTQRSLESRVTAWLYDALRDRLVRHIGMPDFVTEVDAVTQRLALGADDVVLDIACGHGNFSAAFAHRVGPSGLVIGLDIADSMLARAVMRVRREGLANVLLVRGDALSMPFRNAAFAKINCSGGLHQMPDLDRALAEMARVAAPGARLAASGFARAGAVSTSLRAGLGRRFGLHAVPVEQLASALERAGFTSVETRMSGAVFAYASARRA